MQQFLSVADAPDINALLEKARAHKANPFGQHHLGKQKMVINLFFNPSLRTRISTEKAARQLGCDVITYDAGGGWGIEFEDGAVMNLNTAEHVREAAGVLSQYCDILCVRSFPGLKDREADYRDQVMQAFVRHATVPVVSLESATRHPLQSLADCLTIAEHRTKSRPKVVLTWAPHPRQLPQCVANSFAEWMLAWGEVDLTIANPEGFDLAPAFAPPAIVTHDQRAAFAGADFIYAKNWSAYTDYGATTADCGDWTVDEAKMALTNDAHFMHCLPVRRNVVVSDGVIDSKRSLVLQQANNRTWAAQAVLGTILGG
ncbi:N-acetylornithine carbamoyltransferase [Neolewinella lacunae]|uniref:N-succinylornithine carbamoyltransferase n=1 Tax=Neolewinella lacunae TaxID=1517758 RepID=A0A923TCX0_9BACT|nr:N-acetylornithine carbamoyltransferase [Neolewinella lacunae]MBC6994197.1 N-acetylornithine carbamoyltransferase [Neolewinella lacunae]MDN3634644.1 N-acetylornithine carbamoyltransferase [Neolewinella lacunae]